MKNRHNRQQTNIRGAILNPENTFLFSDPHFDHRNIIKCCSRPFRDVDEMNNTILNNYFKTVRQDSLVFFLGDMSFGRDSKPPKFWLHQLQTRRLIYLKGSHDHGVRPTNTLDCYDVATIMSPTLHTNIHLIHDYERLETTNDWIIHGHNHNNRPFFDRANKRVNVSVDVTNFEPVSLAFVYALIDDVVVKRINDLTTFIDEVRKDSEGFFRTIPNLM